MTPPGRLVDIGGRRLHLYATGAGSPAVVLEAGLAASSLSWRIVQQELARFTRAISYDRAGLGWSDPATVRPTLARQAAELDALLEAAGEPPPYILVAHSFGSAIASAYLRLFGAKTHGLVLVDPLRPDEWSPLSEERRRLLARAVRLSPRAATLARAGIVGWCLRSLLAGSRWLPKIVGRAASGEGATLMGRLAGEVAKLPSELWPAVAAHWSNPKCFLAMAEQLEALPAACDEMRQAPPPAGVRVITLTPGAGSGHWMQLDRPELVVDAVRQLSTW